MAIFAKPSFLQVIILSNYFEKNKVIFGSRKIWEKYGYIRNQALQVIIFK